MMLLLAQTPIAADKHNVVWIMADDLDNDWKDDRLSYMPNLRTGFRDAGAFFENHVAAQPVCGPSRSSLLLGRRIQLRQPNMVYAYGGVICIFGDGRRKWM